MPIPHALAAAAYEPAIRLGLLPDWLDAEKIIHWLGPYVVPALVFMVFAECGILIGFLIPAGESLLFTTGLLIGTGQIGTPLPVACLLLVVAACAGNLLGYAIGRRIGPVLFDRPNSRLFKREYVDKTHAFFAKYGPRAVVLARFVPIVRTFITAIAGVGRMDFRAYAIYSTVGGVIWAAGVPVLGYFLGRIDVIRNNIEAMIILIVALSLIPVAVEFVKHRREQRGNGGGGGGAHRRSREDVLD